MPKLPLQPEDDAPIQEAAAAYGNGSPSTEGLAPMLAPTLGDSGPFETSPDKTAGGGDGAEPPTADGVSGGGVKRRLPPSAADEGSELVGVIGFEPTTSCSQSRNAQDPSEAGKGLTDEPPAACTNACTSETQKLLEVLAATLKSLNDEDRARLAELIQRED